LRVDSSLIRNQAGRDLNRTSLGELTRDFPAARWSTYVVLVCCYRRRNGRRRVSNAQW